MYQTLAYEKNQNEKIPELLNQIEQTEKMDQDYGMKSLIDKVTGKFKLNPKELRDKLNTWKTQKLNIGVIGESGCGKSTLINSMRGLYPNEQGAAKVDVKECTAFPTPYPFPDNPNIIIWDLPGVNTPNYKLGSYLQKIVLNEETTGPKEY
jgi:ABC-type bacteriocin/lantibiotic exporter with double-glycine peptidase domain